MCGQGSVDGRATETGDVIDRCLIDASSSDNWQDFLVRLAHGVRQVASDHPELFPLAATAPAQAPWVRPPLGSLRWMETFLNTLLAYGFDDDAAVNAYRSYTTFLLGQLLLQVAAQGPAATELHRSRSDGLTGFPNLFRLQPKLSQDHSAAEFDDALEAVLDRIERMRAAR
ncbi:TetR/AcrR family transcriptional regulator C-terminal domain-containing protein [Nocardia brasiliensis]|uniref:TetR/AcrR family transcriptional regulator C-terminal domain-containing protein n=1 Tax=Nocardia brasiliensis TaxID=37326 RepID=UPI003D7AE811